MSWSSFSSMDNYFHNQKMMIDSFEGESYDFPSFDQVGEIDDNDFQKVDHIAQNNFQSLEGEVLKSAPTEITSVPRKNLQSCSNNHAFLDTETAPQSIIKKTLLFTYPSQREFIVSEKNKEPRPDPSKEDIQSFLNLNEEPPHQSELTSSHTKRKISTPKTPNDTKRRKIADSEDESKSREPVTLESKPNYIIRTLNDRIDERKRIYSLAPYQRVIFPLSKVDIQLKKYIEEYYGQVSQRKSPKTYAPLNSKKIVISKLNTIDANTKELIFTFFKKNQNKFNLHLTKIFDALYHPAFLEQDKEALSLWMNKYLALNEKSPTTLKDRGVIMDRLMKEIQKCLNELTIAEKECEFFKTITFTPNHTSTWMNSTSEGHKFGALNRDFIYHG